MQITPTCVPCLLKRVTFEANLCDGKKVPGALKASCKVFSERYTGKECSAIIATEVHRAAYKALGCKDPYRKVKHESNEVAKSLLPKARKYLAKSSDKLTAAMRLSIIGNILDFGIGMKYHGPKDLIKHFDSLYTEGLGRNDIPKFRHLLKKGARVVYFTDNCGEIIFDGILLLVLRDMGVKVTLVAKGEPILTDATVEDIKRYGIDKMVDEVLDTGTFAVGVDLKKMPKRLRQRLKEADLVISKGMANYESFSDEKIRPIVHMLRTKCVPVAQSMGLPKDISAIFFEP
jgi:uncharacterized protein with ATP-grasp and redox domains